MKPVLVLVLCLALTGAASAADKAFGTPSIVASNSVTVTTICRIFNTGPKPVAIRSVWTTPYDPSAAPEEADDFGCTGAPLQPERSCTFSGTLGVFGGGFARVK